MKKILITLLSFFVSTIVFCQIQNVFEINTNSYLGLNKREIKKVMKSDGIKPYISDVLYVLVNEKGSWDLNEKNYSYIFDYDDYHIISSFNSVTDRCVRTHIKTKVDYYYDYMNFFDKAYKKSQKDELTWYDGDTKIVIHFIISDNKYYLGLYYEKEEMKKL